MMNITKEDFRLVMLGCMRYSLGRMTYMPSVTVQVIKNNKDIFRWQDWKRMIKEIDECDNLGMDCDIKTWTEFKDFCYEQLGVKVN